MSCSGEYSNPTSGGAGCNYHSLCTYNTGGQMAPMPKNAKNVIGHFVVPQWGVISNDALTHGGVGSCSGYFNITSAYGKGAGKCNQAYVTSLCGGCNKK